MVKLAMPTEDAVKDPCEQNLRLLQNRIESEFSNLVEARSEQGELDRIKSREINLIEDRIMKQYARQLVNKHELLRAKENANDSDADRYIQLDPFLNTIGLQPRTIEVLKSDISMTVDRLFGLQMDELYSLTTANDIGETEQEKLHKSWKRLHQHYDQYEQNKKLSTASAADFETTGRLNSVSSDNDRVGMNQCATPSRLQSVRPALPSQSSFNGSFDRQSPPHTPLNISGRTHLSSSSSSLLHHSLNITQSPVVDTPYNYAPQKHDTEGMMFQRFMPRCDSVPVKCIQDHSGAKHTRSHSVGNPLEFEEDLIETPNPRSSSASPPPNDSWSSAVATPSYVLMPHPQMRRVVDATPSPTTINRVDSAEKEHVLSNSGSYDYLRAQPVSHSRPSSRDGMLAVHGSITTSHSHDDILAVRKSDDYESDFAIRHFSTSLSPRIEERGTMSGPTSSSMVNLPNLVVNHENDDYDIGKASSVPRLTIYSTGGDSKESSGQHSMPTSPRTPGNYAPTGHIGHAIPHRFSNKTVLCTTRSCDYCKRSMVFGVKCQKCKYKCHKACARKAPFSCGLPPELEEFFRQRVLCNKNNTQEPSSPSVPLPDVFPIQDLNREPSQGRFSPMSDNKKRFEFSRIPTASEIDPNQNVATLNVPNSSWCHPSGSTSPSLSSPLSSPSMTPRSPLSPQYHNAPLFSESFDSGNSSRKQSDSSQSRHTVDSTYRHNANHSNRNSFEFYDGHSSRSQEDTEDDISNLGDEDLSSVSCDSIEDKGQRPRGCRPPPMIVSQDELPDFVAALSPRNSLKRLLESRLESEDRTSITPTQSTGSTMDDRIGTNSSTVTTSTCASTLTNGSEDCCDNGLDDSFDGIPETVHGSQRFKRQQRGSIFNEWEIPFEQLEIERLIGKSDVSEVYKGKWHGKVTIKKFYLPNATKMQLNKFQLEYMCFCAVIAMETHCINTYTFLVKNSFLQNV
ncbi:kinase suppressor of Ras 2-like isoform X3 [Dysidea avara]|uniref:kinase suppressor of Ras 2-like isoform X3 n=1 Tax=Dysidea avara TaxID=196820 RepID=UPI003330568E